MKFENNDDDVSRVNQWKMLLYSSIWFLYFCKHFFSYFLLVFFSFEDIWVNHDISNYTSSWRKIVVWCARTHDDNYHWWYDLKIALFHVLYFKERKILFFDIWKINSFGFYQHSWRCHVNLQIEKSLFSYLFISQKYISILITLFSSKHSAHKYNQNFFFV